MISSTIISQSPFVIKHVLSKGITETESEDGVNEAINILKLNVANNKKFRMLIDVSSYSFETLEARRIWSLQF